MPRKMATSPLVFLSYAREDVSIAEMLYADLTRAGVRVWFDIYDLVAGQRWETAITDAMRKCSHFLVLVSKNSLNKRGYVQRELRILLGMAQDFPEAESSLIPVFVDRCQPSHPELRQFHWVELYRSYERGLRNILRALGRPSLGKRHSFPIPGPSRLLWQSDITEAGWGVIFPSDCDPDVRNALGPLIEHRRKAASWRSDELFRVFDGERGVRPSETGRQFLERFGVGAGPPEVRKVPFYLLIVGSPEQISFSFQSQLAVQHAVGRLWLNSVEEYAAYAKTVLDAESRRYKAPERLVLFGPAHEGDPGTAVSCEDLVVPLSKILETERLGWKVSVIASAEARKERLAKLFRLRDRPAILFFVGHGVGFRNGSPSQVVKNGALICSDWIGRDAGPVTREMYYSAADVDLSSGPRGTIAFFCSSYSAGTPDIDEFSDSSNSTRIAPRPFVSALPCRLLGHPKGGALAVIGKVDDLWLSSFQWRGSSQIETYRLFFSELMAGHSVGFAMRVFTSRYAGLSTLYVEGSLESESSGGGDVSIKVATLDAKNYIILGDPAVRVAV